MQNKRLICLLTLATMTIAGCNKANDPSTSNSSNSQPSVSDSVVSEAESTQESNSEVTPSGDESASDSATIGMDHQAAFVSAISENAFLRNYNESFDTMIDDFSGASLQGTNNNGQFNSNFLKVLVDNEAVGFPGSPDASIYKMATGTYAIQNYEGIGFKIRLVSGTIANNNLVLGLRGNDSFQVYNINLADAVNTDGEALPELTNDFQDVVVCPNLSIEDDNTVYKLASGADSDTKVLSTILGFHLFAEGECSAVIEVSEVYLYQAGEKTTLDSFNRKNVNKTDDSCWWRDSTGFIYNQSITLSNGASYTTKNNESCADNDNVVLTVCGDSTGTSVTPVYTTGEGTSVAWDNLKDPNGNAVVAAVNGSFNPLVINLEKSGIDKANLVGFKISSTSEITVSSIFATNLKEKEALTSYPALDTANAIVFDSFTRTQAKLDETYEASSTNEKIIDAGLYYSIAYHNAEFTSVDGDALVLKGGDYDYLQVAEGSSFASANNEYLVFVMKLGEGASLDNFRINSNSSGVVYANQWMAGDGLPSIPADMSSYPYVTDDGYAYYIIDLAATNISAKDSIDMYYSGAGDLYIDSIFFANHYSNVQEVTLGEGGSVTMNGGYQYMYGGYNTGKDKIAFNVAGDGTATFDSFRLEYNGSTIYANNGLVMTTEDGTAIDVTAAIPTEGEKVYIDLAASGYETGVADHMHFHWDGEGNTGTVTVSNVVGLYNAPYTVKYGDGGSVTMNGGYQYMYGGYVDGTCDKILVSLKGDGDATLNSFRVEYNGSTIFANNGLVMTTEDGTPVDATAVIPTEETNYIIDLAASGYETGVADHMHFHWDGEGSTGTVVVGTVYGYSEEAPYSVIMNDYVEYVAPDNTEE